VTQIFCLASYISFRIVGVGGRCGSLPVRSRILDRGLSLRSSQPSLEMSQLSFVASAPSSLTSRKAVNISRPVCSLRGNFLGDKAIQAVAVRSVKRVFEAVTASSADNALTKALEFCSSKGQADIETLRNLVRSQSNNNVLPAFLASSAAFSLMFPETASAATTMSNLVTDPHIMLNFLSSMPLGAVEVGKHWYWEFNNLKVHGQVFLASWHVMGFLLVSTFLASRSLSDKVPQGVQNVFEFALEFIQDIARTNIGEKEYRPWVPFVGTLFLFIFVSNWMGALVPWKLIHIPEGELGAPTNDVNVTVAMALMTSAAYFYAGLKGAGLGYFSKYIKPTPVLLPLNIIEDFTKPLSLSFRLFGNILADELVVAVLGLLVPLVVPLPAMLLGLFTSAIQALIFSTLAATYIGEAIEVGHELEHEKHEKEEAAKASAA